MVESDSKFALITVHADNDIKGITDMKNIARHRTNSDKFYFVHAIAANNLAMKSSADFTIDDVIEVNRTPAGETVKRGATCRRFGTYIIGALFSVNDVEGNTIHWFFSVDDGDNWASQGIDATGIANDPADDIRGIDAFYIGAVKFAIYTQTDDSAATTKYYSYKADGTVVVGSELSDIESVYAGGFNSDGDYEFLACLSDGKFYKIVFDGAAFTETEITDDLTPPDTWDSSRQLYWAFRDRYIILTGNQMFQKLIGYWTLTTVAAEQDVVGVVWDKDEYDDYMFDYFFWNSILYRIISPATFIRLETLSVDARVGHDDWFSTGTAIYQQSDIITINNGFISKEKLGFRILQFDYEGSDFAVNDGIVLTESDGPVVFIGHIASITPIVGTAMQHIIAFGPSKKDLEHEVLEDFGEVDELSILQTLFANHTEFLYEGTIDDTGNTQALPSKIRVLGSILRDLEPFGARVVYWEVDGKTHFDEGDEVSLLLTKDYKTTIPGVVQWGTFDSPDLGDWIDSGCTTFEVVRIIDLHNDVIHVVATDDYIQLEVGTKTGQQYLNGWIRLPQTNKDIAVMVYSSNGGDPFVCYALFKNNGKIAFMGTALDDDIQDYSANEWIHVSIIWTKNSDCYLYINGSLISSRTANNLDCDRIRIYSEDADGEFYFDSLGLKWDGYDEYSNYKIYLTDINSTIIRTTNRGQDINAVVVKGGLDPNLPPDAEIPVGIARMPGISQQQLIPAIYNIPSLTTQAEVDARALLILNSGPTALIVYQIEMFGDGLNPPIIPQIGRTINITNAEYSLTNEILIVQSWNYNTDNNSIIFFATNGLLFLQNNETRDVMNVNTERIYQLARIVALRTVPGLTYYLDNNASGIAGYKKMLDTYAGDGLVTFTNTNAIDGEAIEEFATEPNEPGITVLNEGEYNLHVHAKNTQAGSKNARIYFEFYKRTTAPVETLIATSESTAVLTSTASGYNIHAHIPPTELGVTDRLVVKLKVGVSGGGADPDIETYIQGTAGTITTSRFELPSSSQILANKVNKTGDTMTGPLNIDMNYVATPLLTIGKGTDTGDPIELLLFDMERMWEFVKRGTGAGSQLRLEGISAKSFYIGFGANSYCARFYIHETQASSIFYTGGKMSLGGHIITDVTIDKPADTSQLTIQTDTSNKYAYLNLFSSDYRAWLQIEGATGQAFGAYIRFFEGGHAAEDLAGGILADYAADRFRFFVLGGKLDYFIWEVPADSEKMRLDSDVLLVQCHIRARDGHGLYAYSAGNDKFANIHHDDTDTIFRSNIGDFVFKPTDVEYLRLDVTDLKGAVHFNALNGHYCRAYSVGNDKAIYILHDDTNGYILTTNGFIEFRADSLKCRNIADNAWINVHGLAFVEESEALPDDPPNWKELLPNFVKIGTGISIGKVARLALREVKLLKKLIG